MFNEAQLVRFGKIEKLLERCDTFDIKTKCDKDGHYILTPWSLCGEIISAIAKTINIKKQTFLVVDTIEFIEVLIYFGADKNNITYIAPYVSKGQVAKDLYGVNVEIASLLTWEKDVRFDVVIGNPPYNVGTDDTTTGTGGGTSKLFIQFAKEGMAHVKPGGLMGFVTPKGIKNTLIKNPIFCNATVIAFSLMTVRDDWVYDTCYWVIEKTNTRKNKNITVIDYVFNKFYSLDHSESFDFEFVNKSDKELIRDGVFGSGISVIRYLPGSRGSEPIIDLATSKDIIYGPKMVTTILNSKTATIATEIPVLAGTTLSFPTLTLQDAEKLLRFFTNNRAFELLYQKAKFKSKAKALTYVKKFDLTQITTGFEYPKEWGLTQEEIDYVEANVK